MISAQEEQPTFSIIVPTYNNTAVLMRCLSSLSSQAVDRKCFEVIVINDGDEDDLPSKLESVASQIALRYFRQDHRGPAAARNLGIQNARGEIILFLDDDSLPTENWLRAAIGSWKRSNDVEGIGGFTTCMPEDSIVCKVNADIFNWYLRANNPSQASAFMSSHNAGYKASVLEKIGRFDERFRGASGEDRDLNIRICRGGGRLRLDESILVYHDRDLEFGKFVRKYFNYGKASFEISVRYPDLRRLPIKSYFSLFLLALRRGKTTPERVFALFLTAASQVATLAGYWVAKLAGSNKDLA